MGLKLPFVPPLPNDLVQPDRGRDGRISLLRAAISESFVTVVRNLVAQGSTPGLHVVRKNYPDVVHITSRLIVRNRRLALPAPSLTTLTMHPPIPRGETPRSHPRPTHRC